MHAFEQQLASSWPSSEWADVTVLAAVSGGADSVALLSGLCALRPAGEGRIVAAHFNHRLRGAEADADEAFVIRLCGELRVPLRAGRPAEPLPGGSELSAREARYQFFQAAASECGARFVVLAHTADDQAETILHRILRGTGLAGLAGIPRCRELLPGVALLRPMLEIRREQVLDYLRAIGRTYRSDSTNRDERFTRNRVRHQLLPRLAEEFNPEIASALLRLGRQAGELNALVDQLAGALLRACAPRGGRDEVTIACGPLRTAAPLVVRESLRSLWRQCGWAEGAMTFAHWRELAALATRDDAGAANAAIDLPGGVHCRREAERLVLTRRPAARGEPSRGAGFDGS